MLTLSGDRPGSGIAQSSWQGAVGQQWRLEPLHNGAYLIVSVATGMVADVAGASKGEGARVIQAPWHGGTNQQWVVVTFPAAQNVLVLVSLNSGLALDVDVAAAADGAALVQSRWRGALSQIWLRAAS